MEENKFKSCIVFQVTGYNEKGEPLLFYGSRAEGDIKDALTSNIKGYKNYLLNASDRNIKRLCSKFIDKDDEYLNKLLDYVLTYKCPHCFHDLSDSERKLPFCGFCGWNIGKSKWAEKAINDKEGK